jgi:hypothetical protein
MSILTARLYLSLFAFAASLSIISVQVHAETLNPEGINPHTEAPRKRITQEQKQAAADAMKKRKAEIEAKRASEIINKSLVPTVVIQPAASENGSK